MRSSSAMTMLASSMSWFWTVSSARSSADATSSRPPSADRSRPASSSWKWVLVVSDNPATRPSRHVRLGPGIGGVGEDLLGVVELDDPAGAVLLVLVELDGEERGLVRHPRGLLHVVRDDHDRVLLLDVDHQVLDLAGGDRVERRAGLVHQDHVRLDREAACDAEPLLLPARHAERVRLEPVLDLVPDSAACAARAPRSRPCRPSCRARADRRRCCRRSTSGTGSASGTPCRCACAPRPRPPRARRGPGRGR